MVDDEVTASIRRMVFGARIEFGDVPDTITAPAIDLPHLKATGSEALLRVAGVGRFHVRNGRRVTVDPMAGTAASALSTWLDGTVASLVLVQQRRFALHASTVRVDRQLVAVTGPRGAGKSTSVCLLAARGHPVVTDDLTALDPDSGGDSVTVDPSGRRLRLWPSTASRLGYDILAGEPVAPGNDKRSYAIGESRGPHRLGLVVALRPSPHVAEPVLRRLHGTAAIEALAADTYRPLLRTLQPEAHLRWMATVAAATTVVRLDRPTAGWSGEKVAMAVERAVRQYAVQPPVVEPVGR